MKPKGGKEEKKKLRGKEEKEQEEEQYRGTGGEKREKDRKHKVRGQRAEYGETNSQSAAEQQLVNRRGRWNRSDGRA